MNEQWFWEQCGLKIVPLDLEHLWWIDTDGNRVYPAYEGNPPIDLNNLFRYAVPKLKGTLNSDNVTNLLTHWAEEVARFFVEDPAQALFQAIYEAFGGK